MTDEDFIFIEQYINGDLDEEKLKQFQQRMNEDQSFAEEVELRKKMENFLELKTTDGITKDDLLKLNKASFEKLETENSNGITRRMWMSIAASLLLLIAAAFIFKMFSKQSTEQLYEKYAVHQAVEVGSKSGTSISDELKRTASEAFNQKEYSNAIDLLEKYFAETNEDSQMELIQGISYLETEQFEKAKSIFKKIQSGNSIMKSEADWYLALYYLKIKDLKTCQSLLESIQISKGFRSSSAEQLLKDLPK